MNNSIFPSGFTSGASSRVDLIILLIVLVALLLIPMMIMSTGYIPLDDVLTNVALAVGGTTVIQADGTAIITLMNAQRYLLVPDWTLGDVPLEHLAESWWQDAPFHYRYRNTSLPNTSQGFSVKPLP